MIHSHLPFPTVSWVPSFLQHHVRVQEAARIAALRALNEDNQATHEFSCVMMPIVGPLAQGMLYQASLIPDAHISQYGRASDPHVTVLYGIHTSDPKPIAKLLESERPIRYQVAGMSLFPGKDGTYEVLKLDIESEDLVRLNKKLRDNLDHTMTHPEYRPHATIAYVLPGHGARYMIPDVIDGAVGEVDRVVFSSKSGEKTVIPLGVDAERSCGCGAPPVKIYAASP